MENIFDNFTLILISHKSKEKVKKFILELTKDIKIIIIENSNDTSIKEEIEKENFNTKVYIIENNGYAESINFARSVIKTDYFLVSNPDVENINKSVIKNFLENAKKLNNNFACLGPRYTNISANTLIQSDINKEVDVIPSISGAVMFFHKKKFDFINGFDDNFFLYFEETDYCYRARKKGLKSYQLNTLKVKHDVGTSVKIKNSKEKKELKDLHIWHYVWSKFYFHKKHYGFIISLIYFLPMIIRTIFKISFFKIFKNREKLNKYKLRYQGLTCSIKGNNSYKRI
jgi:N-acetylglucosaminyl-diphospho-decaprenol L-rhamnosyltransferase